MTDNKRKPLLASKEKIFQTLDLPLRDGIELQKGYQLSDQYLTDHKEQLADILGVFVAYPDLYLDTIAAEHSPELFFYQRIFLRAIMRYKDVYVVACRAFSKSFISILGMFLQCMFIPGTRRFICAPNKVQGAQIAKEKIYEIYDKWPLLQKEVIGCEASTAPGNFGKDYVLLKFKNGSTFEVAGALESTRGQRKHGGLIDEIRDHDEATISEVVLPLLNVSRRTPDNTVNPLEPNQQVICATSAGTKISYAYDKLIDMFEKAIINPNNAFVFGCDYRVPVMHGLIDKKFVNDLKMSPSYNEESFAREYLGIWSGASDESWFNFDKMSKHRKIKNPEFHAKNVGNPGQFYLISVDVANLGDCQTAVCVFRVNVVKNKYHATLVNLIVLGKTIEEKTFTRQAADIKKLIELYNPKEVLIDCNGLTYQVI